MGRVYMYFGYAQMMQYSRDGIVGRRGWSEVRLGALADLGSFGPTLVWLSTVVQRQPGSGDCTILTHYIAAKQLQIYAAYAILPCDVSLEEVYDLQARAAAVALSLSTHASQSLDHTAQRPGPHSSIGSNSELRNRRRRKHVCQGL